MAAAAAAYLESVSESGERWGGRGLCSDVVVPVAAAAAVVAVDDGGGALVREAVSDAAAACCDQACRSYHKIV